MTPTERYIRAAKRAGCPPDQFRNFMRARIVMQPQQLKASAAARLCDLPDGPTKVGYGGARGGGKSHWGLGQVFCDDCARYPGLKFLYLRKVGKAGKEAVTDLRKSVLHSTPHTYRAAENILVRNDNGSKVILGNFQNDRDIDKYLGLEYDGALIEEATQLTSSKVRDVMTCVRTSKPGWRPRTYLTTNPGNIGHAWFKAMFIKPLRAGTETDSRFIQATVRDNKFVNPENRAILESYTGWQRRAWLDGDWDLAAGQFFTNFSRDAVVVDLPELPQHWRVWLGFDYGFSHYTACYLLAEDGDGNVWVIDEHAERGWLPEQHAAGIRAMLGRHGLRQDGSITSNGRNDIEAILAGWDCFNRDRRGKSIADDYAELGLGFDRADADRINGAAEVLRRLGNPDAAPPRAPRLFIHPRCARLIDCLPSLQRDEDRPEDVLKVDTDDDGLGGDDFYDAFRYGLMYAATDHRGSWGADPFGDGR